MPVKKKWCGLSEWEDNSTVGLIFETLSIIRPRACALTGVCAGPLSKVCFVCAADVLFNRKARLSSNVMPGTQACTAVDGEVNYFSFRTADYDKEPYWEVDMDAIYTTLRMKIYWRPRGCKIFLTLDGLMSRSCKWMCCVIHTFCSLFHTLEPPRRSLGIILCCCILFYFHAPIIWLPW